MKKISPLLYKYDYINSERIAWVDVLKGIGIILVVFGHIYINDTIYRWIYSFHMPLFFFAAGYIYKVKPILTDIKKRVRTVVIPYFVFGLLLLLYWEIIERRFRPIDASFDELFIGLLEGRYDELLFNVHLWFLPCFFVTVVIYNILTNLGGHFFAYGVTIVISVFSVFFELSVLPWGIDRMFMYIAFFAIGNAFAGKKCLVRTLQNNFILKILIGIVSTVLCFIMSYYNWTYGLLWFVTAQIGIVGCMCIAMVINEHNKTLAYLGEISLLILCLHGPIYRVIIKFFATISKVTTEVYRSEFLGATISTVVTLIVCVIIYRFVIKFIPWSVGKYKIATK